MAETYASIVAGCQVELEDYDGQLYGPSLLLRGINLALEDVRLNLTNAAAAELRKDQSITLPAGTTDVGPTTTPPLPADFGAPIQLYERPSGSTAAWEWREVRLVEDLDLDVLPGESLGVWAFQNGTIKTRGATTARELKLDYLADLVDFTGSTEALPLRLILTPLVYFTCSHVVRATDRDASDRFKRDGELAMSKVRSIGNKRKAMEVALHASRRGRGARVGFRPLIS